MTAPFLPRPFPSPHDCDERDCDSHLRRQDVDRLTLNDAGPERDDRARWDIYESAEAPQGTANQFEAAISNQIPSDSLAANCKASLPQNVCNLLHLN